MPAISTGHTRLLLQQSVMQKPEVSDHLQNTSLGGSGNNTKQGPSQLTLFKKQTALLCSEQYF